MPWTSSSATSTRSPRGTAPREDQDDRVRVHGVRGAPTPMADHTDAAVGMAVDILTEAGNIRWPSGDPIVVRGGIATGPAVAGVIGVQRFAYDLWGDTVNLASRLETNAEPGRFLVSESTIEELGDRYDFGQEILAVKGKGPTTSASSSARHSSVPCWRRSLRGRMTATGKIATRFRDVLRRAAALVGWHARGRCPTPTGRERRPASVGSHVIVVGGAGLAENQIVAEMYARSGSTEGFAVELRDGSAGREGIAERFESGFIDREALVPVFGAAVPRPNAEGPQTLDVVRRGRDGSRRAEVLHRRRQDTNSSWPTRGRPRFDLTP